MTYTDLSDTELRSLRDSLEKELRRLRSTVKNLNNTINNVVHDMRDYRIRHGIIVENPQDMPRA